MAALERQHNPAGFVVVSLFHFFARNSTLLARRNLHCEWIVPANILKCDPSNLNEIHIASDWYIGMITPPLFVEEAGSLSAKSSIF